jgi:hypothetical protein
MGYPSARDQPNPTTDKGFGGIRPGQKPAEFSRDETSRKSGILHLKPGTFPDKPVRGSLR